MPKFHAEQFDLFEKHNMPPMQKLNTIKEFGRRFDYCLNTLENIDVVFSQCYGKYNWAEIGEELEKAERELKLCIKDAKFLKEVDNN
jgi:hypothetical protein